MNYDNNNVPGNNPSTPGVISSNTNGMTNDMNYNPNQMNSMNSMNTIAPGMGNLNNNDFINPKPKKNIIPIIIAIIAIVGVVGGLITFKTIMSTPKTVFKNAIKNAYKGMSNTLESVDQLAEKFDIENKALKFNVDLSVDSNADSLLKDIDFKIDDMKLGYGLGLDADRKEATVSGFIKGNKEEVSFNGYYTDEKVYLDTNLLENIVYLEGEDVDIDFEEINEMIDELLENMPETKDVDYLVEAVTNAIADSLDAKYMDKEQEKVDVSKNNQTFTKYSYKISDKALKSMIESTIDKLLDDKKFIQTAAEVFEYKEDEIKEYLENLKESAEKEIEYEQKVVLNIYTKGFMNELAGCSLEVENEEIISYIDDGKEFIITIGEDDNKIEIKGSRNGKSTKITYEDKDDKFKLVVDIKELSKEKIDISVAAEADGEKIGFSVYLTCKEEKTKISGEYKLRLDYNDEYISVNGNYAFESVDKLEIKDVSKAVNVNDITEEDLINGLKEKTAKDEVLNSIFKDAIEEYEKPEELDYYDMIPLYTKEELSKAINKGGKMVLYVGDTFYSEYSEKMQYNLFENLKKAQDEKNFYSYRMYSYNMDYVQEVLTNVTPTCKVTEEPTCDESQAIYFIQDGEVKSAITGEITITDIENELAKIGY